MPPTASPPDLQRPLPASIDTPLFQHAASYTGWAVKPLDPVYDADAVACSRADGSHADALSGGAGTPDDTSARLARDELDPRARGSPARVAG